MAARTNSSWAPRGPRSRSRPSFRMRFKCANLISIFLRACRDRSKPSVPANDRGTSRACSWILRGILRDGSFGQHCGLSGHASQSSLLATEALFGPVDHGFCCVDFGLANGTGGLDINDDTKLHIDEIVVGVSKECWPLVRSGPL